MDMKSWGIRKSYPMTEEQKKVLEHYCVAVKRERDSLWEQALQKIYEYPCENIEKNDPQPEVKEPISEGFYIDKMLIMIEWED